MLPKRVLKISSHLKELRIQLIKKADRSRYCALSHCWGAAEKRPLTTTTRNLQNHLAGILWHQLPQTFREAVLVTLSLGIEYLWIDSLCIVQDDKSDWHREAQKMGMLYRNASLVLAAGGAKDSTESLLPTSRPIRASIRIPYISEGLHRGFFNAAILVPGPYSPVQGPLRLRAWAFQEWYLGRRIVFFMPRGIFWKCR